jgi:hypothetical protein
VGKTSRFVGKMLLFCGGAKQVLWGESRMLWEKQEFEFCGGLMIPSWRTFFIRQSAFSPDQNDVSEHKIGSGRPIQNGLLTVYKKNFSFCG